MKGIGSPTTRTKVDIDRLLRPNKFSFTLNAIFDPNFAMEGLPKIAVPDSRGSKSKTTNMASRLTRIRKQSAENSPKVNPRCREKNEYKNS